MFKTSKKLTLWSFFFENNQFFFSWGVISHTRKMTPVIILRESLFFFTPTTICMHQGDNMCRNYRPKLSLWRQYMKRRQYISRHRSIWKSGDVNGYHLEKWEVVETSVRIIQAQTFVRQVMWYQNLGRDICYTSEQSFPERGKRTVYSQLVLSCWRASFTRDALYDLPIDHAHIDIICKITFIIHRGEMNLYKWISINSFPLHHFTVCEHILISSAGQYM